MGEDCEEIVFVDGESVVEGVMRRLSQVEKLQAPARGVREAGRAGREWRGQTNLYLPPDW